MAADLVERVYMIGISDALAGLCEHHRDVDGRGVGACEGERGDHATRLSVGIHDGTTRSPSATRAMAAGSGASGGIAISFGTVAERRRDAVEQVRLALA